MKRINAMILVLVCLLTFTTNPIIHADSDTLKNSSNPYAKKQELLIALDIMNYNSEGEIDNTKELTRAEFVGVMAKFYDVNPTIVAKSSYFYDVPVDAWYTYSLNVLTDYTIIHQAEDKMFYPNDIISLDEAVKIVVCVLGYRVAAERQGAYPNGYNAMASKLGLLLGMPEGQTFTNAHMTMLLYNAIKANVADVKYDGENVRIQESNKNILEAKRDIYKADGIIESVYGLSIYGKEVSKKEEVLIGKNVYLTDNYENSIENLGRRVRFYYQKVTDDDYKLLYTEPYYENDVVEIFGDDYEKYDQASKTIVYTVNGKSKHATISSTATVMKNGSVVKTGVESAFNINNGQIKLVDSNGDGKFDFVSIYDFKTVVANNLNADTRTLTYKLVSNPTNVSEENNKNGVYDFSESSVDYLTVYSSIGTTVDFAAITQNAVLDIAVSDDGKVATIFINSGILEGSVSAVSEADEEIYIDGTLYNFYSSIMDIYYLKAGDSGKFKVNKFGKISYYEKVAVAGEKNPAVYIVNVTEYHEDKEGVLVKYFDSTGTFQSKLVSEKFKLDGNRVDDNVYTQLSKLKRNIVVLNVNDKDEIIQIDSRVKSESENDSSLENLLEYDGTGTKWNSTTKMFDKNIVVSNDAVVFVVPPISPEYEEFAYDEQSYSIGALSDFVNNDVNDVDCYRIGTSSYCNILVLYKYKYQNTYRNRFIMVTSLAETIDASGDRVTRISGYQSGEKVSYDVTSKYKIGNTSDCDIVVDKGDIITVGKKDNDGLVGNVEVNFDVSRNWSGLNQICLGGYMFNTYANRNYDAFQWWLHDLKDIQSYTRLAIGCPVEVDGGLIKIKYPMVFDTKSSVNDKVKWKKWDKPTDFKKFDEIAIVKSSTPIIVYDIKKGTIEKGAITDICTADTYTCPSQIFIDMRWGEVVSVFVINNNEQAWTKPDVVQ